VAEAEPEGLGSVFLGDVLRRVPEDGPASDESSDGLAFLLVAPSQLLDGSRSFEGTLKVSSKNAD
jgi:hypothetical protein